MRSKWLIAALAALIVLAGCGNKGESSSQASSESSQASETPIAGVPESKPTANWAKGALPQFSTPELGSPIVTLHTTKGDVKMMLFPKAAPLTVENFLTLCEEGYYDGVTFHRVIKGFMAQTGDPTATGAGGESIWGEDFRDEFSDNLHNFRGAISMANAGVSTNSSQFFIVDGTDPAYKLTAEMADSAMMYWLQNKLIQEGTLEMNAKAETATDQAELDAYIEQLNIGINERLTVGLNDDDRAAWAPAIEKYIEVGGTPTLDYKHTVFGQVIEGMDVIDAIVAVEATNEKPNEDVIIESVTIETAK